jgi:hypothetical protein
MFMPWDYNLTKGEMLKLKKKNEKWRMKNQELKTKNEE